MPLPLSCQETPPTSSSQCLYPQLPAASTLVCRPPVCVSQTSFPGQSGLQLPIRGWTLLGPSQLSLPSLDSSCPGMSYIHREGFLFHSPPSKSLFSPIPLRKVENGGQEQLDMVHGYRSVKKNNVPKSYLAPSHPIPPPQPSLLLWAFHNAPGLCCSLPSLPSPQQVQDHSGGTAFAFLPSLQSPTQISIWAHHIEFCNCEMGRPPPLGLNLKHWTRVASLLKHQEVLGWRTHGS